MKVLLHMCCAPCAAYPVRMFKSEKIDFTGFFYNPNIHPLEEFWLRKKTLEEFSEKEDFPVKILDDFDRYAWEVFGENKEERCNMCYTTRIEKTAEYASLNGFDAFTTTLLISPYQDHEKIIRISEIMAKKYKVEFLYKDLRPFFREGQKIAKEEGMYRQKYCGCILSKEYK